jgi:hypothetical protein
VQSTHAAPLDPQRVLMKPAAHPTFASQQPGQVCGEHGGGGGAHTPFPQTSPNCVQFAHTCPPAPHWPSVVPGTHPPPAQHPGQFCGPHVCTHFPPGKHVSPCAAQFWHKAPPIPHAVSCAPPAHIGPTQQPLQLKGEHADDEHLPPAHALDGSHTTHAWPPMPHAFCDTPGRHVSPTQQPAHVPGPHVDLPQKPPLPLAIGSQMSPWTVQF